MKKQIINSINNILIVVLFSISIFVLQSCTKNKPDTIGVFLLKNSGVIFVNDSNYRFDKIRFEFDSNEHYYYFKNEIPITAKNEIHLDSLGKKDKQVNLVKKINESKVVDMHVQVSYENHTYDLFTYYTPDTIITDTIKLDLEYVY